MNRWQGSQGTTNCRITRGLGPAAEAHASRREATNQPPSNSQGQDVWLMLPCDDNSQALLGAGL